MPTISSVLGTTHGTWRGYKHLGLKSGKRCCLPEHKGGGATVVGAMSQELGGDEILDREADVAVVLEHQVDVAAAVEEAHHGEVAELLAPL